MVIIKNKEDLDVTYFKLKNALSWNQRGSGGRIIYKFLKETPVAVNMKLDMMMFRSKPEMFLECDHKGEVVYFNQAGERESKPPVGGTPLSKRVFNDINKKKVVEKGINKVHADEIENLETETITATISDTNPEISEGEETMSASVSPEPEQKNEEPEAVKTKSRKRKRK